MTSLESGRRAVMRSALAAAFVVVLAIVVLSSWNVLLGDLFALPRMRFRHALSAVLLTTALGAAFSFGVRSSRGKGHSA